jgi:4-hydroxy-tetrahydrodipicolinate synthase
MRSMPSDVRLRGVYVPLITPFDTDGSVAVGAVERLCHEYLEAGATGIVALGTTGESTALDGDEKRAVIDACARVCEERSAQLIVGAGTNSTRTTVAAVEDLAGTPALVASLIVVPYYVRPGEAGIVAHYRAVAEASPVPVVLYNVAARTGRHLSAAGTHELATLPNVAGVKHAPASFDDDTFELLRLTNPVEGFAVLGGTDSFLFPLVLMGATGAICASAHVCTERFVEMIECGLAGKVDEGRAHAEALLPVVTACFAEPNPAVFKGVLHAQGRIPTPDLRLPLVPASSRSVDAALAAVERAS